MQKGSKPQVDFTFVNGNISLMFRNPSLVFPRDEYESLKSRILAKEVYTEQKKIFAEYMQIIIRK